MNWYTVFNTLKELCERGNLPQVMRAMKDEGTGSSTASSPLGTPPGSCDLTDEDIANGELGGDAAGEET